MNRHYRMSVALDVDDLLLECIPYAIKLANENINLIHRLVSMRLIDGEN